MTDKTLDSDQVGADGELPSSQVAPEGVKPGSSSAGQPQGEIEERLKRIEKMVSSFQSGKDRAVDKVSKDNTELRESLSALQSLMKKGLSEDEAFEELDNRKGDSEFRSAVIELRNALTGGKPLPAQASEAVDMASVITQYGLSYSDPIVVAELQGKSFTNLTDAKAAILDVKAKKEGLPNPTQAQVPSQPATPAGAPDVKTLTEKYRQETLAARGKKEVAKAIKDKYRKMGVPVDGVTFSI